MLDRIGFDSNLQLQMAWVHVGPLVAGGRADNPSELML